LTSSHCRGSFVLPFAATLLTLSVLAPGAAARPGTTAPGARAYIGVVITKQTIVVSDGSSAARGAWVIFHILNRSRSTAKLSFLGKISKPVGPGLRGSLAVFVIRRGAFPLVASLARHKRLRQTFVVY
jgi:hypothetical protein